MKHSFLQLARCFITDISCAANSNFDPSKNLDRAIEGYSVDAKVNSLGPTNEFPGHPWSVEMLVSQKIKEGQNFPYKFHIRIMGVFAFQDGALSPENEIQFVRVNGSSMLYGIAREHIRALTAAGPWISILIPTMSFYDAESTGKEEALPKAH